MSPYELGYKDGLKGIYKNIYSGLVAEYDEYELGYSDGKEGRIYSPKQRSETVEDYFRRILRQKRQDDED